MNTQTQATRQAHEPQGNLPASLQEGQLKRSDRTIGIVGLGHMGSALARSLAADGHQVLAFDRDFSRASVLKGVGVGPVQSLAALSDCEAIVTSLPDDDALSAVVRDGDGLLDCMQAGAVHISMSTISPGLSQELANDHATRAQHYVAAPVLGNPDLARDRKLFVLAAGDPESMAKARPLLDRFGQRLFLLGEKASQANLMKLAGNVLTAITLESMGEVLALLRKSGMDQHLAFEVLTNSLFDSKVHRTYGGKIVDERYSPAGMAVPLAVKDVRLALAEAERQAVPMPAASLVHDRLVGLVAAGHAALDWSALGLLAARDAGLPFEAGRSTTADR
ncbi:NAD-binding protein [Rhizobium lusitanum]|uniref:NAD-binding protein n=1 Tax=Rhizobium lusitanum TaxID=293958 RepID=A0A6L9UE63_9HYPH|nr:NAD(P)-dependent oxidoreductase [Rhizobium lusitanum]NEI72436.1 NAD-binding protein [Rhizobium lusitanum]